MRGYVRPELVSSDSCRTVSSEDEVIEDETERAGVQVGVIPCPRARASASCTAERYEAALVMWGNWESDLFFPKSDLDGEGGARAMGEGMLANKRGCSSLATTTANDNRRSARKTRSYFRISWGLPHQPGLGTRATPRPHTQNFCVHGP